MGWDENVNRANEVIGVELNDADGPRVVRLLAAGIVLVVQAIDDLREVVPREPIEISDVTPKYPRE
jgi:hypothetical protein